jgi:hypothetical protein
MRSDVEVRLGPGDRERLEAVLADRNSAFKVWIDKDSILAGEEWEHAIRRGLKNVRFSYRVSIQEFDSKR